MNVNCLEERACGAFSLGVPATFKLVIRTSSWNAIGSPRRQSEPVTSRCPTQAISEPKKRPKI